jgi:hypothetical protein
MKTSRRSSIVYGSFRGLLHKPTTGTRNLMQKSVSEFPPIL